MLTSDCLQFLYELSQNNNREWFEKNKPRYEQHVKKPFEQSISEIIEGIRSFEPDFQITPKDCVFRLHRDTRFSNDKTPYKTHVAAVFTAQGRKTMHQPGYYLHLEFGSLQLGGGAYFLEKEPLRQVRTAIASQPQRFRALIEAPEFRNKFGDLKGEKNKILPAEFRKAAETEPLLFNKQFYFMTEIDPEMALGANFPKLATDYFRAAKDLNDFLSAALLA